MSRAKDFQSSAAPESGPDAAARMAEPVSRELSVSITVNGQAHTITVEPRMTLLDALREELALTGTKKGCDRGECGACTVHVDGRRVLSCMTLVAMQHGKRIATIEEAKAGWPSAATADLTKSFRPSDLSNTEIRERMSGNLCRCACYPNI